LNKVNTVADRKLLFTLQI